MMTPLMEACYRGYTAIAAELLRLGAFVNAADDQMTALVWAADGGFVDTARVLLAAPDVHVNARMSSGVTALSIARRRGHASVVQLLEAAGARQYGQW